MPFVARPKELQLALLSIFAAADVDLDRKACSGLMDRATAVAWTAAGAVTDAETEGEARATRIGAARVLNSICAACRACPRGQDTGAAKVKATQSG